MIPMHTPRPANLWWASRRSGRERICGRGTSLLVSVEDRGEDFVEKLLQGLPLGLRGLVVGRGLGAPDLGFGRERRLPGRRAVARFPPGEKGDGLVGVGLVLVRLRA